MDVSLYHSGEEYAKIHYLNTNEVEALGELYRREIAETFRMPQLANALFQEIFEKIKPMVQEGRDSQLVERLEKAARISIHRINNAAESVRPEDIKERTNQTRTTLEKHYIQKTIGFREEVAEAVWQILLAQMLGLEKDLEVVVSTKYFSMLEQVKSRQAANEFAVRRSSITSRTNRFRKAIETIRDLSMQIRSVLESV